MLTGLLHAHSGLRYLVLLAGFVALAYALFGVVTRRPFDRGMRITATSFAGLLHLQVLLGFVLLVSGLFRTEVVAHLIAMLAAAAAVQIPLSLTRRQDPEARTFVPLLIGVALSLALIWGGIHALGLGVFDSRAF